MTTIVDALQAATQELHDAAVLLQTLNGNIQTNLDATTTRAQTIVNNFLYQPLSRNYFCDPVNGLDSNDGSTPDKAMKTVDAILATMTGPYTVNILLLADTVLQNRTSINGPLNVYGAQKSATAFGYIFARRKITFLGTAVNSPIGGPAGGASYGSGIYSAGASMYFQYTDFDLPDMVGGQTFTSHLMAATSLISVLGSTITATPNAGTLFGVYQGRIAVALSAVGLGQGAPGHVFDGVAAGGDPNSLFAYVSNIHAA